MKQLIRFLVGVIALSMLVSVPQATAAPIQRPTRWVDEFADDGGLHRMIDTQVAADTAQLKLARSAIIPDQYVTSGLATSVIINPLVATIPMSTTSPPLIVTPGLGDFIYVLSWAPGEHPQFLSYQLSLGIFREIHNFEPSSYLSMVTGTDGVVYVGVHNRLFAYYPDEGRIDNLVTMEPSSVIHRLAAAPSGLIYGIAGPRLFSYNPTTSGLSDLGLISSGTEFTALTVADNGRVYIGNKNGHLLVYGPGTGPITDKGRVLGQYEIRTLVVGSDGHVYGGTIASCGDSGRFFSYDPASDSISDITGPYGGVYALVAGKDDMIYGAVRRNDWEAHLLIYDPVTRDLREIEHIKAGNGHVSALAWASDARVFGTQTESWSPSYDSGIKYNLVAYDTANSEFRAWDSVTFDYSAPVGTSIRVDVLDVLGNMLITDIRSGDTLSSIDSVAHPALQLRATLTSNGSQTPSLDSWAVRFTGSWTPSTISGSVVDRNDLPMAGVTLSVGSSYMDIAGAGGNYVIEDLPAGMHTIVPSKEGCVFTPQTRVVSVPPNATAQDFIGRCDFDVSGWILDGSGNPFPGVSVTTNTGAVGTSNANGSYTIENLIAGTYEFTATMAGYTFSPAMREVTVPPDALGQSFTILAEPVSITLPMSDTGNLPTSLVYTDTQGLPTIVEFPADAVTQTVVTDAMAAMMSPVVKVILTPTLASGGSGNVFAGHAFDLALYRDGRLWSDLAFNVPVTVTIHYSPMDVKLVSDESQLALWRWAGEAWEDASDTCPPPPTRDHDLFNRTLTTPICSPGKLSLFGPTQQVYLPMITHH